MPFLCEYARYFINQFELRSGIIFFVVEVVEVVGV